MPLRVEAQTQFDIPKTRRTFTVPTQGVVVESEAGSHIQQHKPVLMASVLDGNMVEYKTIRKLITAVDSPVSRDVIYRGD